VCTIHSRSCPPRIVARYVEEVEVELLSLITLFEPPIAVIDTHVVVVPRAVYAPFQGLPQARVAWLLALLQIHLTMLGESPRDMPEAFTRGKWSPIEESG
jgi:hypothetical protein